MSKQWPMVKLGDVFKRVKDEVIVQDDETYARLTIRMNGNGIVQRDRVPGHEIGTKKQFIARAGQLVLSKIDARNGAFGILPPECDNAIITGNFWAFDADKERLLTSYFDFLTKTPMFVGFCIRASEGTTNRLYMQEDEFLAQEMMLPPLAEQRRVVARIEELAAQIHEARTLRHQAAEEAEVLIPRATSSLLDDAGWASSQLGEILAEKPRNGLGPQQVVESGGRAMLRINAVSSSPTRFVDMNAAKQVGVANDVAEQFVIQNDDVFIVRYNGDINRVAKPAIYKGANESRTVFPDKLIRLRPNSTKMTPDFLVFALNSRSVRTQIEELGKTTAGNIGISGSDAKSFVIPVPPLAEQRRIVAELDALQAEMDALKRLQTETAAELAALLPAILDRAFKGQF